jgi:hypothetical protein
MSLGDENDEVAATNSRKAIAIQAEHQQVSAIY